MRIVIATCSVNYKGRLKATLPSAKRLIMTKADGCVAVHADTRGAYKPLMWMNAPNRIEEVESSWIISNPKGERLTISIEEILSDTCFDLGEDPGLQKDGVEAHLQLLLAENPEEIEEGLSLTRREFPTDIGPVDMLCRDNNDKAVALSLIHI